MNGGPGDRDLLVILDGLAEPVSKNATTLASAKTPFLDRLAGMGVLDRIDPQDGALDRDISSERGISRLLGMSALEARDFSRGFLLSLLSRQDASRHWFFLATPVFLDPEGRLLRFVNAPANEHAFWTVFLEGLSGQEPWRFLPVRAAGGRIDRMVVAFSRPLGYSGCPPRLGGRFETVPVLQDFFEWLKGALPSRWTEDDDSSCAVNGLWLWGGGEDHRGIPPSRPDRLLVGAAQLVRALGRLNGFQVPSLSRATGDIDTDLAQKMRHIEQGLRRGCRRLVLHLEGFDMASHRRDPAGKKAFLEKTDRMIFSRLVQWVCEDVLTSLSITSDHQSSPVSGNHEAGSVPALTIDRHQERRANERMGRMTEWSVKDLPLTPLETWAQRSGNELHRDGGVNSGKDLCLASS